MPGRSRKVRDAIELARRAQGKPVDESELDRSWPGAPKHRPELKSSGIRWVPAGESIQVLTFADVVRELGIPKSQVEAMVAAGDLATIRVGDFGARMVPRAELDRILWWQQQGGVSDGATSVTDQDRASS